ncbi:M16 family metallopeptidase [Pendulispora albinea]|uniref:Insulinase family protein n=1 Tax=Pendulispora albinea TaxID=2741071 RepID=A0ABZ2M564_9BACT
MFAKRFALRRVASFALTAVLALGAWPAAAEGIRIPHVVHKLKNGMTVILSEDHSLPLAVVNVSYNVGSRFEAPKRTGFAHLFEHLMFMGTRRAPTGSYDAWMEALGGANNAWTSEDRTDYFDVGPKTILPLFLWLEADRLRDLGPLMTQKKLDAQREIVRNERRQRGENTPYGKVDFRLPELLYPEGHPYHHPVIGSHADLEAATVDDVKAFFATYYDPANASLVVAGDFAAGETLEKIRAYFETIPSRGAPKEPKSEFPDNTSSMKSVVRETMEDEVELPKVIMAWQTPKHFSPGDAELDLLSNALAGGKASRLYKALVYEQKIAQNVEAVQASGVLGSRFTLDVMVRPGVSLDRVEKAIDAELQKVRTKPLEAEELTRAKNIVETGFVARLEGVAERASILNLYQAELGTPDYAERDLERYRSATGEGIRATVQQWLKPDARVILRVVPKGQKAPEKPGAKKTGTGATP